MIKSKFLNIATRPFTRPLAHTLLFLAFQSLLPKASDLKGCVSFIMVELNSWVYPFPSPNGFLPPPWTSLNTKSRRHSTNMCWWICREEGYFAPLAQVFYENNVKDREKSFANSWIMHRFLFPFQRGKFLKTKFIRGLLPLLVSRNVDWMWFLVWNTRF